MVLVTTVLSMHTVCSARVIFESDLMQDFLDLKQSGGSTVVAGAVVGAAAVAVIVKGNKTTPTQGRKVERKVDLRVFLPDHSLITVPISEHWRATEVFQVHVHILSSVNVHIHVHIH